LKKSKEHKDSKIKTNETWQAPTNLNIAKSFPKFFGIPKSIFSNPENSNTIWLNGDGGVIEYDINKKKVNRIISGNLGIDTIPTSIAVVNNNLFVSFQGGFKKINLITKERKTYTEKDGLVSASNVYLFPDPHDKKIIWIGTFRGLSKFNIYDESFVNFQNETGVKGTTWGIDSQVRVGEKYVWVIVNANGIARYDKNNNTWKAWGPESFNKTSRVDFYEFDIDENRAFAIGPSNNIFAYRPSTDSWEVIAQGEQGATRRHLVYSGNRIYFYFIEHKKERIIKYINLSDYSLHSLNISEFTSIYNDKKHERLMLFTSPQYAVNNDIVILNPKTNEQKIIPLNIDVQYKLTNIIDSYQDLLFLKSRNDFYIYDRSNSNLTQIDNVVLRGFTQLETADSSILGPTKEKNYKIISATNNDNSLTVEAEKRVNGNTISVRLFHKNKPNITKTLSLGARYHNPFGWPPEASVTNLKFSEINPKTLWIGTNRGLIWYNIETGSSKLFTTENGLVSNFVEELFVDNQLIVEHPIGVYIYSMDFKKN